MIHAVAIDDEPLALEVLASHAKQLDFLSLDRTFTNASEGVDYLLNNKTDALFLDIKMPDRNGLDIAAQLPGTLPIIFTTAYTEFAVNGFELNATDYLLKPISLTRFLQACNKIRTRLEHKKEEEELFFKENGAWHKLLPEHILYIEAQGNYLKLVTKDRNYLVRQTMHELEQKLPMYFAKTHKSYIVNTRCIDRMELQQVTIGFSHIPLSELYRKDLFNRLGLKNG